MSVYERLNSVPTDTEQRMARAMDEIRAHGVKLGEDTEDGFRGYVDAIKKSADISRIDGDILADAAETYALILQGITARV